MGLGFGEFLMGLSEKTRNIILLIIGVLILLGIVIYCIKKSIPKIKSLIIRRRNKKLDKEEELLLC